MGFRRMSKKQDEMLPGDYLFDEKRFDALTQRLKKCRSVKVVGLPEGICMMRPSYLHPWYCQFRVKPFQVDGGEVQQRDLTVYKQCAEDYLDRIPDELFHGKLPIKFRARVLEEDVAGHRFGMFTRLDGFASDGEFWLENNQPEKQEGPPATIAHRKFGSFELDRSVNWYEAAVKWGKRPIQLTLQIEDYSSLDKFIETAEAVWSDRKQLRDASMDLAVTKLLKLKNRSWLGDGEKPLTESQFLKRLKLRGIYIMPRRRFALDFDDGDLFLGHSVIVEGSLTSGPTKAGIF